MIFISHNGGQVGVHWCAYKRLHRPWARLHTTCTYYIQIQLESFRTTLTALLHAVSHADVDSWSASLLLSPDDTQSAETSPRVSRMFILPVFCDGGTCGAVACRGRAVGLRIVVSVSRSSPPVCEVVDGESLSGSGERVQGSLSVTAHGRSLPQLCGVVAITTRNLQPPCCTKGAIQEPPINTYHQ